MIKVRSLARVWNRNLCTCFRDWFRVWLNFTCGRFGVFRVFLRLNLPVLLSQTFLACLFWGESAVTSDMLTQSFRNYISVDEKCLIDKCLAGDMKWDDEDETRWGQTTPCLCASRVGRFFQNGAEKVCKGLWVSPYWISALKRLTLIQFCRNLVRAMQIWRPFQEIANFYLSVDIYQG